MQMSGAKIAKRLVLFFLLPLVILIGYTFFTLHWVYSSGERAGFVQKISEKGFVCKTYEGELVLVTIPGTQAEKFLFTAKNKAIFDKINETIGQRVRLLYKQHKWIPSSCFGDTEYFVYDVKLLENQEFNGSN